MLFVDLLYECVGKVNCCGLIICSIDYNTFIHYCISEFDVPDITLTQILNFFTDPSHFGFFLYETWLGLNTFC